MDNNLNNILEIKKEENTNDSANMQSSDNSFFYEKTLRVIANIILIAGLLLAVILFFKIGLDESYGNVYFNINGFLISVYVLCGSIVAWAFFHVICNISAGINKLNK